MTSSPYPTGQPVASGSRVTLDSMPTPRGPPTARRQSIDKRSNGPAAPKALAVDKAIEPEDDSLGSSNGSAGSSDLSSISKGKGRDYFTGTRVVFEGVGAKGLDVDLDEIALDHRDAGPRIPLPTLDGTTIRPSLLRADTLTAPGLQSSFASSQRPILSSEINRSTSNTSGNQIFSSFSRRGWMSRTGTNGTVSPDKKRLHALGFEEELARDYDFWASWGIGVSNVGFLSGTYLGVLTALDSGGPSLYAIGWPITGIFMSCLAAILGEMASTYPVAGAMFTWTFRLCRSNKRLDPWARYSSWINASFLLCSHILTQIVLAYQLSHLIQGIVSLYRPTFEPTFWRSMGICWAILIASGSIVSSKVCRSPWLWRACGASIVIGFLIMNITLLCKAPKIQSAKYVFTTYNNGTGWSSKAYVYLIGWVLTCVASGMEASAHVAEDTKNPSRTVPLAMFWSTAASYLMGWISICVILATAQPQNLDNRLQASIGLLANTVPRPFAALILVAIIVGVTVQNVAQLLATSRFIWALARESALPFSNFFRTISKGQKQPIYAIWVVIVIASLALLLLGVSTDIVGTIFLEGAAASVMVAYVMPIIIYLTCDRNALTGDGRKQWSLRQLSKPLSWFVVLCGIFFLVVLCFPTGNPVTALSISYASVVTVGVLLLSSITWIIYGNAKYAGPIKTTTRWTVGAEVELPSSSSFKSATNPHETTSGAHGRSAHVFSSFPTVNSQGRAEQLRTGEDEETGDYESGEYSGEYETEFDDEESQIQSRLEREGAPGLRDRRVGSTDAGAPGLPTP